MTQNATLVELRLTSFKSHKDQSLNIKPLTLLVGANGSGKSNVVDALSVLALLAEERAVADLERGDDAVAGLRGGLSGAAPFGTDNVKLGCSIEHDDGTFHLDFEIDPSSNAEVISEKLVLVTRRGNKRVLIESQRQAPGSGISDVSVYSGRAPKRFTMLSSRLAIVQAVTRIPADTKARTSVVNACALVVDVLRNIFVLDPVPGQMRSYAQIGAKADRNGTTLSAIMYELMQDSESKKRLTELVQGLVGANVQNVTFAEAVMESRPIDVMVALEEAGPSGPFLAQARVMSDGTLRYLSIVSTLLELAREGLRESLISTSRSTLVVEEIENGLFPTQASRILDLLRMEATRSKTNLLATTHSPALLDALRPQDHDGVSICSRDESGYSHLQALVDHERYIEMAGNGLIGTAVARGELSKRIEAVDVEEMFS